jgi:pyruvate-ferredoxin/flavodoxin oxidoreductase
VEAGYWHLFRYDPRLKTEGKNPFQLDSKEPKGDYEEFIKREVRYTSLTRSFPEKAPAMYSLAAEEAKKKYNRLTKRASENWD